MTQQENDFPIKLSAPARRALLGAGYLRLEQLTRVSEAEIKRLHGIGPNALNQLRQALEAKGLSFNDPLAAFIGALDSGVDEPGWIERHDIYFTEDSGERYGDKE